MNGYNFTDRVRKVLAMAREAASHLSHEYVGTEHILLGILAEGEGVASTVLQNLGVDFDALRSSVINSVKRGQGPTGPDLPYTSRAKKVLELAMSEARELDHTHVGTEHLLLGLFREKKGIAAQVLADAGLTLEKARVETLRILGADGSTPPSGTEAHRVNELRVHPSAGALGYNFTERTRKVLALTRDEADRLGHPYIGTEHILLGLLAEGEGVASTVLQNLGVDFDALRSAILNMVKPGRGRPTGPDLPYTFAAKKVLELGMSETRDLHHTAVGTEHLLLGLLGEAKGIAAWVLVGAGVTLEKAREETLRILGTEIRSSSRVAEPGGSIGKRAGALIGRAAAEHLPKSARRLREICGSAHDVAVERQSPIIAPTHLAIALLRHRGGMANAALDRLNFDRAAVLSALNEVAPRGTTPVDPEGVVTAAPEVVVAIEAMEELRRESNAATAGSHHLLLALIMTAPDVDFAFAGQHLDVNTIRESVRWISG